MNKISMKLSRATLFSLSAGLLAFCASSAFAGPPSDYQVSGQPEARGRMKDRQESQNDASATLKRSTDLYESIVTAPHGKVPESVRSKAKCVAILPGVTTGALVVGGTHGSGVASCKENNKWSAPAFVKLNAVSIGAQIGGKSSDIVLFVLNDKGMAALKKGAFSIGADASVVAGTFDQNFETSTHGAVAYTMTEGAFVGASLSGGKMTSDDEDTAAFYGKDVNYISLMEGRVSTNQNNQVDRLISLLPR